MPGNSERVDPKTLWAHPDLTPPQDPVLIDLLKKALTGDIPVYFAAVPLKLIQPFSNFDPRKNLVGRQAIVDTQARWRNQQFQNMLVYQQGEKFVMSDDYITYYACLEGDPDFVPCWVLGECTSPEAHDVQGPIKTEDLNQILLGAD